MTCIIYGNCQSEALWYNLLDTSFNSKYEDIKFVKNFELKDSNIDEYMEEIFPRCDLLLTQNVSDKFRGYKYSTKRIFDICDHNKVITFPNCYYKGYFPNMAYCYDVKTGNRINDYNIGYTDINLYKKYQTSGTLDCNYKPHLDKKFYDRSYVIEMSNRSLDELSRRDEYCAIKITDWIRQNFRHHKLFHTFDHPTGITIDQISRRIINKLELDEKQNEPYDLLNLITFPLYKSVYNALDCTFDNKMIYNRYGKVRNIYQMNFFFKDFYDYIKWKYTTIRLK